MGLAAAATNEGSKVQSQENRSAIVEGIDARATKAKFKATWRDGNEKKNGKRSQAEK